MAAHVVVDLRLLRAAEVPTALCIDGTTSDVLAGLKLVVRTTVGHGGVPERGDVLCLTLSKCVDCPGVSENATLHARQCLQPRTEGRLVMCGKPRRGSFFGAGIGAKTSQARSADASQQ